MTLPAPTVLLVAAAGQSTLGRHMFRMYAEEARRRGVRLHVVDEAEQVAAGQPPAPVEAWEPLAYADPAQRAAWAEAQLAAGHRFDAVFSGRDDAQIATAELAEAFGAPGNPPHAVRTVRNKDLCREHLRAAGFRQPRVWLCTSVDDARRAVGSAPGPWVVKPRDGSGSQGVTLVREPAELPAAVTRLDGAAPFIVEEFVDGDEYSVEGVFVGGKPRVLGITAKEVSEPPQFIEVGHVLPAPLPDEAAAEMTGQVEAALLALDLRHGIFHVELWRCAHGVVLGEVHVRPGGDFLHLLLAHAVPDLEVFGTLLDDALGRVPAAPLDQVGYRRAAAVRYLLLPPGRVVSVEGWDEVASHPAVLHSELAVTVGETVPELHHSYDRRAVLVVGADTPEGATGLARELAARVRVRVEEAAS